MENATSFNIQHTCPFTAKDGLHKARYPGNCLIAIWISLELNGLCENISVQFIDIAAVTLKSYSFIRFFSILFLFNSFSYLFEK